MDAKLFDDALDDFAEALRAVSDGERRGANTKTDVARVLSGRALAHEGLGDWRRALADYDDALRLAREDGNPGDPFVLNSRGNVKASLGLYDAARRDYLDSAEGFRRARGFGRPDARGSARLDGEAFARGNAALMLAQIGEEFPGGGLLALAVREMQSVSRKAPQSVDAHAMLAAAYWRRGEGERAESEWQTACESISAGCGAYRDLEWVRRIRRWPPAMVAMLEGFLGAV